MKELKEYINEDIVNEIYAGNGVGGDCSRYLYSMACLIAAGKDPRKMVSTMADPIDELSINKVEKRIECIKAGYIVLRELSDFQITEKGYKALIKRNPKLYDTLKDLLSKSTIKDRRGLRTFISKHPDLEMEYRTSVPKSYSTLYQGFMFMCDYILTNDV